MHHSPKRLELKNPQPVVLMLMYAACVLAAMKMMSLKELGRTGFLALVAGGYMRTVPKII